MRRGYWILTLTILIASCAEEEKSKYSADEESYDIIVGGHIYGHSDHYTSSVYPKFLLELKNLAPIVDPNWIILTGDVVAHPTPENWETVRMEMDSLGVNWIIAPGNHDISHYMDTVIQSYKYKAIRESGNLLLTLTTSHPGWCPDSLQKIFIAESLNDLDSIDNIFVFSHQLWWLKDSPNALEIDSIRPNSYANIDGDKNFWDEVFIPYFKPLTQDVYFIAGDMGCHELVESYYEDHHENFHFYASGMGGGVADNFLHIKTYADGEVVVNRVDF